MNALWTRLLKAIRRAAYQRGLRDGMRIGRAAGYRIGRKVGRCEAITSLTDAYDAVDAVMAEHTAVIAGRIRHDFTSIGSRL